MIESCDNQFLEKVEESQILERKKLQQERENVRNELVTIYNLLNNGPQLIEAILQVTKFSPDLTRYPNATEEWNRITTHLKEAYGKARSDYQKICKVIAELHVVADNILNFHNDVNSNIPISLEKKLEIYFPKVKDSQEYSKQWGNTLNKMWSLNEKDIMDAFDKLINTIGEQTLQDTYDAVGRLEGERAKLYEELSKRHNDKNLFEIRSIITEKEGELESAKILDVHIRKKIESLQQQLGLEEKDLKEIEGIIMKGSTDFAKQVQGIQKNNEKRKGQLVDEKHKALDNLRKTFNNDLNELTKRLEDVNKKMIEASTISRGWFRSARKETVDVERLKWTEEHLLKQRQELQTALDHNIKTITEYYDRLIDNKVEIDVNQSLGDLKSLRNEKNSLIEQLQTDLEDCQKKLEENRHNAKRLEGQLKINDDRLKKCEAQLANQIKETEDKIKSKNEDIQQSVESFKETCRSFGMPTLHSAVSMLRSIGAVNRSMNSGSLKTAQTQSLILIYTTKLATMINEIQNSRAPVEYHQEKLVALVKKEFPKCEALIKQCEDRELDYDLILETLDDTDLLKNELGLTGLVQRRWKNLWRKEKEKFEEEKSAMPSLINQTLSRFIEESAAKETKTFLVEESHKAEKAIAGLTQVGEQRREGSDAQLHLTDS